MENILTVARLNGYIKGIFDSEELLSNILVLGEVSNFSLFGTNAYFNLKDSDAQISCVCFDVFNKKRGLVPRDGQKVILRGSPTFYVKGGKISFNVVKISDYGMGDLFIKFNELKNELESLGVFDIGKKKKLPANPKTIGIITSEQGAVIHDIIKIIRQKNKGVNLVLYPVAVQGATAEKEIEDAINFLDVYNIDTIILARGGGSFEDFAAFNSKRVVMAIYNSKTPLISAVGHETDFSLSDFAADVRAATPSAAAEIAVPDTALLRKEIKKSGENLKFSFNSFYNFKLGLIKGYIEKLYYKNLANLNNNKLKVINQKNVMFEKFNLFFDRKRADVQNALNKLDAYNPAKILNLGYAKVLLKDESVVSVKQVSINDSLKLRLKDGSIEAKVLEVKNDI